jgi:hypothetical protein
LLEIEPRDKKLAVLSLADAPSPSAAGPAACRTKQQHQHSDRQKPGMCAFSQCSWSCGNQSISNVFGERGQPKRRSTFKPTVVCSQPANQKADNQGQIRPAHAEEHTAAPALRADRSLGCAPCPSATGPAA